MKQDSLQVKKQDSLQVQIQNRIQKDKDETRTTDINTENWTKNQFMDNKGSKENAGVELRKTFTRLTLYLLIVIFGVNHNIG